MAIIYISYKSIEGNNQQSIYYKSARWREVFSIKRCT